MMLAELQRDFRVFLTDASPTAIERLGGAGQPGLAVYQNNYRSQLVGCLESSYPQLRLWIGADAFLSAAVTHIDDRPPHGWTLDAYGAGFCATLAEVFPDNPDIQEFAWIENALSEAFVAADAAPVTLADLDGVDWDHATLRLTPSLQTHVATTNAESIWSALWESQDPPQGEMLAEARGTLIWRRGFTPYLKQIDQLELEALRFLLIDPSFASLCAMLAARLGEEAGVVRAGELLAGWLGSEIITGIGHTRPAEPKGDSQ
jgi:hypothetical protein